MSTPGTPTGTGTPARTGTPSDAAILGTAGSLVVLLASTYAALEALPAGGGVAAPALLGAHVADAVDALRRARAALGDASRNAGGRPAQAPEPTQAAVVAAALPTVRTPGDVVALALSLEDVLAQTLVADVPLAATPAVRQLCAGLGAEAAARTGRLLILSTLLAGGGTVSAASPPDLAGLPASVGTAGVPDARFPTERALAAGDSS